jgi:hypothetical protein
MSLDPTKELTFHPLKKKEGDTVPLKSLQNYKKKVCRRCFWFFERNAEDGFACRPVGNYGVNGHKNRPKNARFQPPLHHRLSTSVTSLPVVGCRRWVFGD